MKIHNVVILMFIAGFCYSAMPEVECSKILNIEIQGVLPQEIYDETVSMISNKMIKNNIKLFAIVSSKISSEYDENMLIDERRDTCWAYSGESAWVIVGNAPVLCMLNGLWASEYLYYANNRPKNLRIRRYYVTKITTKKEVKYKFYKFADAHIVLPDRIAPIIFTFRYPEGTQSFVNELEKNITKDGGIIENIFFHRLDIESVYGGTLFNDTCVSYLGPSWRILNEAFERYRKTSLQKR